MKLNFHARLTRVFATFIGLILLLANASNPPDGNTGAPFNSTCSTGAQCHTGNSNGYNGTVTISGITTVPIPPSTDFNITLTIDVTAGSPTSGGFQLVAVDGANANAGTITNLSGETGTNTLSGRTYVEHRNKKTISGGSVSWTFKWKSPASASGNMVKFYFTGNMTNSNNNSSGDYIITANETYTLQNAPPLSGAVTSTTNVSCNGGNNGSATAEGAGGVPSYAYHWSNGLNAPTTTGLTAGTYYCTITDNIGQTVVVSTAITQPPVLNVATSVVGTITCSNPTATVNATASGGTAGYNYIWSTGDTGSSISVSTPGTISLTVTDANDCTKTASVNVQGNTTPPIATAGPSAQIGCGNSQTNLNGTGSSQGANFTYLWTASNGGNIVSGATTLLVTVNAAGTYTLLVTNTTNGCTATDETYVTQTGAPPNATAVGGTITCAQPTVTLDGGSTTPFVSYMWSGPNNFTSPLENPTTTVPGTYTVIVTDPATSCTSSATATVSENLAVPNATAQGGTITCASPSVTLMGSSSSSGTTPVWTYPGGATNTTWNPVVSAPGSYTLVVVDQSNGCTSSATAIVSENITPPTALATASTITCTNTSAQLTATTNISNATYLWTGPGGFTSNLQNPVTTLSGSYTVAIVNPANGCSSTATAEVISDLTPPGVTATGGSLNCVNSAVTLMASSPTANVSYLWSGPGGFTSSLLNPIVYTAGTYLVQTTGPNGCTSEASVSVTSNTTPPTISIAPSGALDCNHPTLQLNATASSQGPSIAYIWTTANGNIVSGATTTTPIVDAPGDYQLVITDITNGCTAIQSIAVAATPAVSASISSAQNVSCHGGSNGSAVAVPVGGTGTFTYAWSNNQTGTELTGVPAGNYSVTVMDGAQCTATATVTITEPLLLASNASATGETATGANDGTASAAPSGGTPGYTYEWSNGGLTATITGLAPGNYTVTVGDANGCTAVQAVTVNSFNCNITSNTAFTNITCNGANNGTAALNLTGAVDPIAYAWSNGAITSSVSGLSPGTYTVNATDANGCPVTASVSISEPTVLAANATSTNETAAGANDGTATAQPTGGSPAYSYLWSNNEITATISNLPAGTYSVVVTDQNGCTAVQTVVVNGFNCSWNIQTTAQDAQCFGSSDGVATAITTGGSAPFTYAWSNGGNTATVNGLAANTYSVLITDADNCSSTAQVVVGQPTAVSSNFVNITHVTCVEDNTGSITVEGQGGTGPYTYDWSIGQVGNTISNLAAGVYNVVVTDSHQCSVAASATIQVQDNVPPTLVCPPNMTVCGPQTVTYPNPTFTDNCLIINPIFEVTGLASGAFFDLGTHTQTFLLTDANGNQGVCSFDITATAALQLTTPVVQNDVNSSGQGSIDISVSGGTPGYTFSWTGPNGFTANTEDINGLFAGLYILTVTDTEGCFTETVVFITDIVATNDPIFTQSIQLVPNPAMETVSIISNQVTIASIQIFSTDGRLEITHKVGSLGNDVDLRSLPEGMYFVKIISENGLRATKKLVKSN